MLNLIKRIFQRNKKPVVLSNGMVLTSSGLIQWGGSEFTPEYLLGLDINQLQHKALHIWWNSVHARGAISQLTNLTTNTGLRLQSLPLKSILDLEADQSQEIAKQLEDYFEVYRHQKAVDYYGKCTFNELEIIGRRTYNVFGEVFAVMRRKRNPLVPIELQLINPLAVKSPPSSATNVNVKNIKEGIEFKNKKPVAFWFEAINSKNEVVWERIPFKSRNGKPVGLHVADIQVAGSFRGTPRCAPVFHEFQRIQESLKLELDSMATNASIAVVIERDEPVLDKAKIKSLINGGTSTTDLVPKSADEIEKKNVETSMGGIVIQDGDPGEKFKSFDTSRPNINIPEFIDREMDWIGPAIGLPSSVWKMLFQRNYAGSKGEVDLAWKNFDVENYIFSAGFEQPVYEGCVDYWVQFGMIILIGWSDPIKRAAYLRTKWRGIPQPILNPLQEAKASTERLTNRTSNQELESQKVSGVSAADNNDRMTESLKFTQEVIEQYEAAGVDISVLPLKY